MKSHEVSRPVAVRAYMMVLDTEVPRLWLWLKVALRFRDLCRNQVENKFDVSAVCGKINWRSPLRQAYLMKTNGNLKAAKLIETLCISLMA